MPKRVGWTVLTIGAGLLLSAVIIMYLAFSAGPGAPSRLESALVSNEGTVSWSEDGGTMVQAGSLSDGLYLLGYGHARSRAWQMALWRQAALGRLSEWFGPDALPADRLVRQLDIPGRAALGWDQLDPESRQATASYAAGIDRAISAADLNRGAPFLILDIQSEAWEGWHTLAVERLFAWLSSANPAADSTALPAAWSKADTVLSRILAFHGAAINHAAGITHGDSPYMAARFATGTSGIPFYAESEIDFGSGRFTGVVVPGALIPLMGRTHADAWVLTGRSERSVTRAVVSSSDLATRFHRIRHAGEEEIVEAHITPSGLLLDPPLRSGESRTVRVLRWAGDEQTTDASQWVRAFAGTAPRPSLLAANGITWSGTGFAVMGRPQTITQPDPDILFVTSAPEAASPQATVAGMKQAPSLDTWMNLTLSRAASGKLDPMLPSLADSMLTGRQQQEAVRYLRNWNLEYGAAEPGASILETLLTVTRGVPENGVVLRRMFGEAVQLLSRQYGPDMSSWRWETVQNRRVGFPGATSGPADGGRPEERFIDKYQPVQIRAPGHPQTLVWGSPPAADPMRVTSVWEGTLSLREGVLHFRRPSVDFNRFLGTFLTGDRPPEIRVLRQDASNASTSFIPSR